MAEDIRKSALIRPFGIGALYTGSDKITRIHASLDYWYKKYNAKDPDLAEFKIDDIRLTKRLGVDELREPADYRKFNRRFNLNEQETKNTEIKHPFFIFPRWVRCGYCLAIEPTGSIRNTKIQPCPKCKEGENPQKIKKTIPMRQVNIIGICTKGHIQDFPWIEYAHSSTDEEYKNHKLILENTPLTGAAGWNVRCLDCGEEPFQKAKKKALDEGKSDEEAIKIAENAKKKIPQSKNMLPALGEINLSGGIKFTCKGHSPWFGENKGKECDENLIGSYTSASNIYNAEIQDSIYIKMDRPEKTADDNEIIEAIESKKFDIKHELRNTQEKFIEYKYFIADVDTEDENTLYTFIDKFYFKDEGNPVLKDSLKRTTEKICKIVDSNYSNKKDEDRDIFEKKIWGIIRDSPNLLFPDLFQEEDDFDDPIEKKRIDELNYRIQEYKELSQEQNYKDKKLKVIPKSISEYEPRMKDYFEEILLIDRLTVSTALVGFTRGTVSLRNKPKLSEFKKLLRADNYMKDNNWLPAIQNGGEGVFIKFNNSYLREWEKKQSITTRLQKLINPKHLGLNDQIKSESKNFERYILLHTFSHALIRSMTFESGYSSSALKERIYVSNPKDINPMEGLLIYTASSGGDGSLGGLVRLGSPNYFEKIVETALKEAQWCTSDPVCMEQMNTDYKKQDDYDPENLAACHNCLFLPETACENFNKLLDRATIVPQLYDDSSEIHFFKEPF